MNQNLDELLSELDSSVQPTSEHSIFNKLISVTDRDDSLESKSERIAFSFCENYENHNSGWGTYFGPISVWTADDGQVYENPSLSLVTEEMLDYWEVRAQKSKNHLMKARYTGLIWDLTPRILNRRPNHKTAFNYVNSLRAPLKIR